MRVLALSSALLLAGACVRRSPTDDSSPPDSDADSDTDADTDTDADADADADSDADADADADADSDADTDPAPTWSGFVYPLLQEDCVACHGPSAESFPLSGDATTDWEMVHKGYVNVSAPAESRLVRAMIGAEPKGHTALYERSDAEVTNTMEWIGNGARND